MKHPEQMSILEKNGFSEDHSNKIYEQWKSFPIPCSWDEYQYLIIKLMNHLEYKPLNAKDFSAMPTQEEIDKYLKESRKQWDEDKKREKVELDEKQKAEKSVIKEIRSHKRGRKIPLVTYSEMYETLDFSIEDIEEKLATCIPLEDIAEQYNCRYVTFRNWLRESKEYARIRIAIEFSAEYHVSMGFKLIRRAIEDPDLTMQQAALLRAELYNHNAVAAFRQPKVFGKKAEEGLSASTVVIATDDQIGNMIEKFKQIAEENRRLEAGEGNLDEDGGSEDGSSYDNEFEESDNSELDDESEFQDAEEVK